MATKKYIISMTTPIRILSLRIIYSLRVHFAPTCPHGTVIRK